MAAGWRMDWREQSAGGGRCGDSRLNAGRVSGSKAGLGIGNRDLAEEVASVSGWKRGREGREEPGLGDAFEPWWLRDGLCGLRKWDTGGSARTPAVRRGLDLREQREETFMEETHWPGDGSGM